MEVVAAHLLTLASATVLVVVAFIARQIPRAGRRGWALPAWALMLFVLVLFTLADVYADEAYSLYLALRGEQVYSQSRWTEASPRALIAIKATIGVIAIVAAAAHDLSRSCSSGQCSSCAHRLLEAQTTCPECGAARLAEWSGQCSRLDVLATRKPMLATLLEFSSVGLAFGAFMALTVAFMPTARACIQWDSRGIAETNKRKVLRLTGIATDVSGSDSANIWAHAEVGALTQTVWAPLLPKPGWIFGREIRVRISAQVEADDAPRKDITRHDRYLHWEDTSITADINSVESYRHFVAQLEASPFCDLDLLEFRRYLKLLMTDFLHLSPEHVPSLPSSEAAPTPRGFGTRSSGFVPPTAWPDQIRSNPLSDNRDPFMQTLVLPGLAAASATLVLFWPKRRSSSAAGSLRTRTA
jgi:ferredoxin